MKKFTIEEVKARIAEDHQRVFALPENGFSAGLIARWDMLRDRVFFNIACDPPRKGQCHLDEGRVPGTGWVCIAYSGGVEPDWLREEPTQTTVSIDVTGIETVRERLAAIDGARVATIEGAHVLEMRWRGKDATGSRSHDLDASKTYDVRVVERAGL